MKRVILAGVAVALGTAAVLAQSDPIAERKALMDRVSDATSVGAKMIKGDEPFSLEKVKATFQTYIDVSSRFTDFFPESSKQGKTRALPKIWEDMAGFKAADAKFNADSKAALAATKDLETFKASFGTVARNCNTCHSTYRGRG